MMLAVDIGGTSVKLGLVDASGVIHARHEASVSFDGYQTPILHTVLREARAFLERDLNECLCNAGTRVARTEEIFLVNSTRLHGGNDVIVDVIVGEIKHIELRCARLQRLFLKTLKLVCLTDVTRHRDNLAVVVIFLQPGDDDRGIETARVGENDFFDIRFIHNCLQMHKYSKRF